MRLSHGLAPLQGAMLCFDSEGEFDVTQFEAVSHPPLRPMAYASGGMGNMFGF